ncbi:MAG: pyruvate carboxylase subunit A [Syntrophus sp. SKADARSKE-3]|nr:pyruvate carboxylase subunit A [Syntrophus sp. SKADARSKE-3]
MEGNIKKVLIANRGVVAVSIIKALHEMGKEAVAVYEKTDADASFIRLADEAFMIGNGPVVDYLNIGKMIHAARQTGADAVHPGYGFLAESADFAEACKRNGLIFIGPPVSVMRGLGAKVAAKATMKEERIATIPGTDIFSPGKAGMHEALAFADQVGYPIMLKAVAGGGGRGIRRVDEPSTMKTQLHRARHEAAFSFNCDSIYAEKCIMSPRHIEVQILADRFGHVIHLASRDCSIQRRHQKLMEVAPAQIPDDIAGAMYAEAVRIARHTGYVNAGTVEFLYDTETDRFWFMEVNTRLQVEHPVTEMVTGIDIIKKQIEIAEGKPLELHQSDVTTEGIAIHVRINAEDPLRDFCPDGGRKIEAIRHPHGFGLRLEEAIYRGYTVPSFYDSLLAKLTVRGDHWVDAVDRLQHALEDLVILGPKTTIPFYLAVCNETDFRRSIFTTSYLESHKSIFERMKKSMKPDVAGLPVQKDYKGAFSDHVQPGPSKMCKCSLRRAGHSF